MTKRRKIFLIILLVAIALITTLCVKMYLFFTAKPNIAVNYVAEWDRISKPENYDPNQNAFFDYQKAAAYFVDIPEIMKPEKTPDWPEWPGDMNGAQLETLKNWLNDNAQSLEYIKEGSKKPYFWNQTDEKNDLSWFKIMYCIQALCWHAKLAAFENQNQQIIDNLTTCYRVSRQLTEGKRGVREQIFGIAFQSNVNVAGLVILANHNIEKEFLKKFQNELEKEIYGRKSLLDFSCMKILMYDTIQDYFSDDGKGNGHLIISEFKGYYSSKNEDFSEVLYNLFSGNNDEEKDPGILWLALFGPDRKQNIQMADELIQYYQDLQETTPWQLHKDNIEPDKYIYEEMFKNYIVLKIRDFARTNNITAFLQSKAAQSALVTITAILRFKAENSKYPENLDELIDNNYLKELPQDPYNDGALTYKKVRDDFILYSLGPNFIDEDGKIIRDENGKIRWWNEAGDTVFWPRPKETKEEIEKREELKRQKEQKLLKLIELRKKKIKSDS